MQALASRSYLTELALPNKDDDVYWPAKRESTGRWSFTEELNTWERKR